MRKLFIFDIDGTLTPSRQKMSLEFQQFFRDWSDKNDYFLVTGSDIEKTKEQIPEFVIKKAEGIFTCCGNVFYKNKILNIGSTQEIHTSKVYEHTFTLPKHIEQFLYIMLDNSKYPHRYGNHVENRGSMVNFSIVGRDCNLEQRKHFFEWDEKNKERQKIADIIKTKSPVLDASLGGQISIDIHEKDMDKSQILYHIKNNYTELVDNYVFIGDKVKEGGNDYPLAYLLQENTNNGIVYETKNPENTMKILKELND